MKMYQTDAGPNYYRGEDGRYYYKGDDGVFRPTLQQQADDRRKEQIKQNQANQYQNNNTYTNTQNYATAAATAGGVGLIGGLFSILGGILLVGFILLLVGFIFIISLVYAGGVAVETAINTILLSPINQIKYAMESYGIYGNLLASLMIGFTSGLKILQIIQTAKASLKNAKPPIITSIIGAVLIFAIEYITHDYFVQQYKLSNYSEGFYDIVMTYTPYHFIGYAGEIFQAGVFYLIGLGLTIVVFRFLRSFLHKAKARRAYKKTGTPRYNSDGELIS